MIRSRVLSGVVVALVLVLAGCSSSGTLKMEQSAGTPIRPESSVSLTVTSLNSEDAAAAAEEMRTRLFGLLVSQGVFDEVRGPDRSADYTLAVAVSGVEEVSQGSRILLGALAGSNKLAAAVTLTDTASSEVIRRFMVTGESAAHPMSSENGMDDAVREASSRIVTGLR